MARMGNHGLGMCHCDLFILHCVLNGPCLEEATVT